MLPTTWRKRGSLLGPTLDDFVDRFFYNWPAYTKDTEVAWTPRVDINETDKEITVDTELPGIDKKKMSR